MHTAETSQGEWRSAALTLATAALALLGACASYEPRPLVPEDEVASLRRTTVLGLRIEHASPGSVEPPRGVRFDPGDGLDEAELIAVALTLNPALRARRLELGEAKAVLITAGFWPNPDLGAFLRPDLGASSSLAIGLDLLAPLLRPDERPAMQAIAEARVEVVRATIAAEEYRVAAEVRRARLGILAADQIVSQLQREAQLRDDSVDLIRRQRELGEGTSTAVALVELDRARILGELREARAELERGRRRLNRILGVPAELDFPLTGLGQPLTFVIHADPEDADIEHRVLAGRFDLRAREGVYRQSEQELRLAVARQYPRFALGPSFEKDVDGDQSLGLGASVEIPVFYRNQGEFAARYAERERARAEYVASLHGVLAQAFDARSELRRARQEVDLQQREVLPLVERTEAMFEGAFRAREATVYEWITARSRCLQARRDALDALVDYANAVAELEATTGMPLGQAPDRGELPKHDDRPR